MQVDGDVKAQANPSSLMDGAFGRLLHLPPSADKSLLMSTIDGAVTEIIEDLENHNNEDLTSDEITRVKVSLNFLEQCLEFKDADFTSFAKKRAKELQDSLVETIDRIAQEQKLVNVDKDIKPEPDLEPDPITAENPIPESDETTQEEPEVQDGFAFVREEKILTKYAFDYLSKRLKFLRGDTHKVVNLKKVPVIGINTDGVAPIFFMSPKLPKIIEEFFVEMIQEKRDLLERRVYIFTNKDMSDQEVLSLYEETYRPDIIMIIAMEFDNWAGEMAKVGIGGLPQEVSTDAKGSEKEEEGIGASLKKVFSFGGKKSKTKKKKKHQELPDILPVRTHKAFETAENKGVFHLSQHFSFSILSYILNMNIKQFETEYECIRQIVDQQEEADVGPVVTNLSRLYKFYDNIFFDLVILVLFQRKNKFDINMLQAACMSQNFVVDRLPLTMDELRRRPMEHAKHIMKCLKEEADKEKIAAALTDYFYIHETIHESKVGKRIQASENLLQRQGDKLDEKYKKVADGIQFILREVKNLKVRQEEESTFLGEEIEEAIENGIAEAVDHL